MFQTLFSLSYRSKPAPLEMLVKADERFDNTIEMTLTASNAFGIQEKEVIPKKITARRIAILAITADYFVMICLLAIGILSAAALLPHYPAFKYSFLVLGSTYTLANVLHLMWGFRHQIKEVGVFKRASSLFYTQDGDRLTATDPNLHLDSDL